MQFMLMCGIEEKCWNALPAAERDGIMDAYRQWIETTSASGHHIGGGKLDDSIAARTLRQHDGRPRVMDGPFAETREQIGGFHILECRDQEEALQLAQQIPTLAAGGVIEVRPLLYQLKD